MTHINNSYEPEETNFTSLTRPCGDDNRPYNTLDEFKSGDQIRQPNVSGNGENKGSNCKSRIHVFWILVGVAAISAVSATITIIIQTQDFDNVVKNMREDVISVIRDTDKGSTWSSWSPWEGCSATCGVGIQRRNRTCNDSGQTGTHCKGSDVDMVTCNDGVCSDNCGTNTRLSPGTNCLKYYWCSFGDCVEMLCSPDTMYDVNTKLCKPTDHVTCPDTEPVDPFECQQGEICIDLNKTGEVTGQDGFPGFNIRKAVTSLVSNNPCSRQAVFKMTFDRAENDTCQSQGLTGRKMLKVQIFLSDGDRSEWMFDIGDSISNNGQAGDSSHSDFSSEIQGIYKNMDVFANTKQPEATCKAQKLYRYAGGANASVSRVTTYIGNRYLKVTNDNGLEDENCNECLWGLAGQYDKRARGDADEDIYVAMNRVVHTSSSRTGYGVCFLKMKWVNNSDE